MSLFKKIFKGVKKVVRGVSSVGQFVPGPIGAASRAFNTIDAAVGAVRGSSGSIRNSRLTRRMAMATPFNSGTQAMSIVSGLPTLARGAGQIIRRNAGTIIGTGATVGAILYDANGNPVRRKRPRSKGITARELKSFTRVTGLLNKYCKTPPPTKRRGAPSRGKSCR